MQQYRRLRACLLALSASAAFGSTPAAPLHQRIDQTISASHLGGVAEPASDAEFLRRCYLHLIGRGPAAEEVKAFLADTDADKRARAIDTLLQSDAFNDFFAVVLDVMLMERRGGTRVSQDQWRAFLRESLARRQPLDALVRSVLSADGTGEEARGAAKFLLERDVEPNALTRDVGRIFLGRDLQCAQCHDHPNIDDYEQSEYYGIFAFLNRSYLFEDEADNKQAYVGEKAEGTTEFKSVFFPKDGTSSTLPRLLDELVLDVEPRFDGEDAYLVPPSKTAAGVPKFSRRGQLARLITHSSNPYFARNVANRLWAHMLGQGIVDPVDFHHGDNPPSNPGLLALLADELITMRFDLREFLRQVALSRTYQQSMDFPTESLPSTAALDQRIEDTEDQLGKLEALLAEATQEQANYEAQLAAERARVADADQAISEVAARLQQSTSRLETARKAKDEGQQRLTQKQQEQELVSRAFKAADEVARALSQDAELGAAQTLYQQRADALQQELTAIKENVDEQSRQIEGTAQELSALSRQLATLKADRIGFADMVAEARGAMRVFARRHTAQRWQRGALHQELANLRLLQDSQTKLAAKQAREELLPPLEARSRLLSEQLRQIELQVDIATKQVAAKTAAWEGLRKLASSTDDELEAKRAALAHLTAATADAQEAAQQLADARLHGTAQTLAEHRDALTAELAATDTEVHEQRQRLRVAEEELRQARDSQELASAERDHLRRESVEQQQTLQAARDAYQSAANDADRARDRLREAWQRQFVVRAPTPLTPEQLAGSTITALGLKARFQREAEAEWLKQHAQDASTIAAQQRTDEISALVRTRVSRVEATFVSLFAAPAGAPQDVFSATADQALFFANDGRIRDWLSPAEGTLVNRLQSLADADELANELYLAILSRPATPAERGQTATYLKERASDRHAAIQELAWGLLASLEFRFNH